MFKSFPRSNASACCSAIHRKHGILGSDRMLRDARHTHHCFSTLPSLHADRKGLSSLKEKESLPTKTRLDINTLQERDSAGDQSADHRRASHFCLIKVRLSHRQGSQALLEDAQVQVGMRYLHENYVLSSHCNFPPFSNGQSVHQAASHLGIETPFCCLT